MVWWNMAETLHEFMRERAENDFLREFELLKEAAWLKNAGLPRQAILHGMGDRTPSQTNYEIFAHAAYMGLTMAGEAAKHIERGQPELVERFPDFPFVALKRLRDAYSHPSRYALDESRVERMVKDIQKCHKKLRDFTLNVDADGMYRNKDGESLPIDNYHMECIVKGLEWYALLSSYAEKFRLPEYAPLYGHPASDALAADLKCSKEGLPILVVQAFQRVKLTSVGDNIDDLSLFYRRSKDCPLDRATIRDLILTRNKLAHFNDFVGGDKSMGDITVRIPPLADKVVSDIQSRKAPAHGDVCDVWAAEYTAKLTKHFAKNTDKLATMDRVVKMVSTMPGDKTTNDAWLIAFSHYLEKASSQSANEILNYLENKKDIKSNIPCMRAPENIAGNLQDCPHILRVPIRKLASEVIELTKKIGDPQHQRRTH